MKDKRTHARDLAHQYIDAGDIVGWFEALYDQAAGDPSMIPWADLRPNPNLVSWLDRTDCSGRKGSALVVGCGLGDDAELLAQRGFRVVAFDVSATAIKWCQRRFPNSAVTYETHDLFQTPSKWNSAFDLVVEVYTLQVLPAAIRCQATRIIADWLSADGRLLVIARGREPYEPGGEMPWPLVRHELDRFAESGLTLVNVDDFLDGESPPVRRFRAEYRRLN